MRIPPIKKGDKVSHWRRLIEEGYEVGHNMRGQQLHFSEKHAKEEAKRLRERKMQLGGGYLAQAVRISSPGMETYWLVMYKRKK